jgi:hypothetical protein
VASGAPEAGFAARRTGAFAGAVVAAVAGALVVVLRVLVLRELRCPRVAMRGSLARLPALLDVAVLRAASTGCVSRAGVTRRAAGRAWGVREVVTGMAALLSRWDSVVERLRHSSIDSFLAPFWFIQCNVFRALVFPDGPFVTEVLRTATARGAAGYRDCRPNCGLLTGAVGRNRRECHYGYVRWSRSSGAVVITSAPRSPDFEFNHRRRRYTLLMALRVVCLLAAVLTYRFSLWLALALVVGGAVLPWCAVLIANDGPPRKRVPRLPPVTAEQSPELPGLGLDRTIDG